MRLTKQDGKVVAETLEIAGNVFTQGLGLMGRARLPENGGLLIPHCSGIHMMFMRFPIDAVFLDRPAADGARRVVSVHRELRPWTGLVPFVRQGHGVLELPAGVIDATMTAVGDVVAFEDWPEAAT